MAELGIASSGIRIDHDNNALIKLLEIMPILEKTMNKGERNAGPGVQPNAGQGNKPRP